MISEVWEKKQGTTQGQIHTARMWADLYHLNHGSDPIFTPFKGPAHKDHHTIPGEGKMRDMYVIHYQPKTPPSKL